MEQPYCCSIFVLIIAVIFIRRAPTRRFFRLSSATRIRMRATTTTTTAT